MEPRKLSITLAGLLLLIPLSLAAGADEYPRVTPRDYIYTIRSGKDGYTGAELIRHSLHLSGAEESAHSRYIEKFNSLVDEFKAGIADREPLSSYEKGEEILLFLHERLFRRYDEMQTRIHTLFNTGIHNCVSSAVVYSAIALEMGIPVAAVSTSDHVFCSVVTEEGIIDVETTSRYGFHPGIKREFTDSFGKTGYTYVPPGNYSKRERADLLTLLSFILQNRIAELQREQRYGDSVGLAVDRYALLGNDRMFREMVSEFINYAASLNKKHRYDEGIEFLRYVEERFSVGSSFDEIYETLTNNRTIQIAEADEIEAGIEAVEGWERSGIIGRTFAGNLFAILYDKEAFYAAEKLTHEEAVELIDTRYGEGKLTPERYTEFIVFLFGKKAEAEGRKGSWMEAADTLRLAVEKVGQHPQLVQGIDAFQKNYAIGLHNKFADFFNRGDFGEALSLVLEGLEIVPDSSLLLKDLRTVERALEAQ